MLKLFVAVFELHSNSRCEYFLNNWIDEGCSIYSVVSVLWLWEDFRSQYCTVKLLIFRIFDDICFWLFVLINIANSVISLIIHLRFEWETKIYIQSLVGEKWENECFHFLIMPDPLTGFVCMTKAILEFSHYSRCLICFGSRRCLKHLTCVCVYVWKWIFLCISLSTFVLFFFLLSHFLCHSIFFLLIIYWDVYILSSVAYRL